MTIVLRGAVGTKLDPTDAELAVLRVLWKHRPLTVREVHDERYRGTGVGYTTTLKLLQNLLAKKLVRRDARGRQHIYRANVGQDATMRGVVRGFIERVGEGGAAAVAMHALGTSRLSSAEFAELKALIRRLERGQSREGGR